MNGVLSGECVCGVRESLRGGIHQVKICHLFLCKGAVRTDRLAKTSNKGNSSRMP